MSKPSFLLLALNLLVRRTFSQSPFVLDFEPVNFRPENRTDTVFLAVKNQDNSNLNTETLDCAGSQGPFGNGGTLVFDADDISSPWQIRISTPKDYYLRMSPSPSRIEFNMRFGAEVSCPDIARPKLKLVESPVGKFETDDPDPLLAMGCSGSYLWINLALDVVSNEDGTCNILDGDRHDFKFDVTGPQLEDLQPGEYIYEPCLSYMKVEGVKSIQYKSVSDAPNPPSDGRSLEQGTCVYCPPGEPCPCCDDAEPGTISPTTSPTKTEQKPSSVAIAGVILGAIATALGLVNLCILISRRTATN